MPRRFASVMFSLTSLAPLCLAACASSTTPRLDQRFGDATRLAFTRQIAFPNAAANPDPVAGLDGRSAGLAMEQYRKSFDAPPPMPAAMVNVGK